MTILHGPFERARVPEPRGTGREPDFLEMLDRLRRSVNGVCPVWLRASSEDIVQSAMVRVLEISRTRESTHPLPASYLWKVAYSAVVDEIRRRRRRPEVALDAVDPESTDPADPVGPEDDRAFRELGRATEACLKGLPDGRRAVVGFHLLGYTAGEISASLGWGEKRVRNLLHRGLIALRSCLESKGIRS